MSDPSSCASSPGSTDPWKAAPRYDLVTNYRCGSAIEEMERSDDGEWVRWEEVDTARAEAALADARPSAAAVPQGDTAQHASAPEGHKCSDCQMDQEACPRCYAAWWARRHPNVAQLPAADPPLNHYFTPDPTKRFCTICGDNGLGSVWGIHRFQIQPGDPDFKGGLPKPCGVVNQLTGASCELPIWHTENHLGGCDNVRVQWPTAAVPPEFCYWSIDDHGGDSQHETTCGHAFEFTDPDGVEGFKFCGWCGRPLVEQRTSAGVEEPAAVPPQEQP